MAQDYGSSLNPAPIPPQNNTRRTLIIVGAVILVLIVCCCCLFLGWVIAFPAQFENFVNGVSLPLP